MKQLIALFLCLTLLLAACGKPAEPGPAVSTEQPLTPTASGYPLTGLALEGELQRPVAVMVNNDGTSRDRQWGVGSASVVMEGLTEGETTNYMLWFDRLDTIPKVGPVAQAKDLFWQFAIPMNSLLVQKGMNSYAENMLNYFTYQPLDALMLGVNCFDFDNSDPALGNEFCWFTQGSTLQYGVDHYQMPLETQPGNWQLFGTPAAGAPAAQVSISFSPVQFSTFLWENDAWTMYRGAGAPQLDANTGAPVKMDNVVVLQTAASVKDNKFTREYDLTGGTGLYLVEGTWQAITWKKGGAQSNLQLFAADGTPLVLKAGKTYLAMLGDFAGQAVAVSSADGAVLYPSAEQPAATPAPAATEVPVQPAETPAPVATEVPAATAVPVAPEAPAPEATAVPAAPEVTVTPDAAVPPAEVPTPAPDAVVPAA